MYEVRATMRKHPRSPNDIMAKEQFTNGLFTDPFTVAIRIDRPRRVIFKVWRTLLAVKDLVRADVSHGRAAALASQGNVLRTKPIHAQRFVRLFGAPIDLGHSCTMNNQVRHDLTNGPPRRTRIGHVELAVG